MAGEKVTRRAEWNPVTNVTTITDSNGTRQEPGNQTSNFEAHPPSPPSTPPPTSVRSKAGGVSASGIIEGQESGGEPTGGGYSGEEITEGNSSDSTDSNSETEESDKKKDNDS